MLDMTKCPRLVVRRVLNQNVSTYQVGFSVFVFLFKMLLRNQVVFLTADKQFIIRTLVLQKFLVEKYSVTKFPTVIVVHRRGSFQELSQ